MQVGDYVVFANPLPDEIRLDGTQITMEVLEMRGEFVLVADNLGHAINPTRVVRADELELS